MRDPHSSKSCIVTDVNRNLKSIVSLAHCQFELQLISHAFPIVPQCLTSVLGRALSSLGAILQLGAPKDSYFNSKTDSQKSKILFLAILQAVDPSAWDKESLEGHKRPTSKN